MTEKKLLHESSRASSFEKILATTGAINWQANNVSMVVNSRIETVHAIRKGVLGDPQEAGLEFHEKMLADAQSFLDEKQKQLHQILEDLMDFCNGCDAVSETDIYYGEAVLDLLNDVDRDADD